MHLRSRSPWSLAALASLVLMLLATSSCMKPKSELLQGRWYSKSMSIRFRPDSGVIWNSDRGLAIGRYEFTGEVRSNSSESGRANLKLDVIRNSQRSQFLFELRFLGNDRVQLRYLPPGDNSSSTAELATVVLKRAQDDSHALAPAQARLP